MNALEKLNASFKAEADVFLYEHCLLKILEKYGTPFITGSYALGTMLRRDLDVNLGTDKMTEITFFQIGGEIATTLKPARMLYLNEFVLRHPRLPLGYYLGVSLGKADDPKQWNIDIWSMNTDLFNKNRQAIIDLHTAINDKKRALILKIKHQALGHHGYQRNFFSMDIYQTVINGDVKTAEEFFEWVKENRDTDLTI